MKKLLIALAAVLVTASSYGQGTIYFSTRVVGVVDAPVTLASTGAGPGPSYSAQLFLVGNGGSLTPLTPATTFRDGSANPTAAKYVIVPNDAVTVPGVPAGGSAQIAMGAWQTSLGTFDQAKALGLAGLSAPITVDNLGGGAIVPANLTGAGGALQGFVIPVPEPSVIALGILGASALLLRRRK